jgi:hypothetical protein
MRAININRNILESIGSWRWCIGKAITILNIIHRPVFYLRNKTCDRTSQETHYVSATSPTGKTNVQICNDGINITATILNTVHCSVF